MEYNRIHGEILQLIGRPVPVELYQQVVGYLSREIAGGTLKSVQHRGLLGLLIEQLARRQDKKISCQTQMSILIAHSMQQALDLQGQSKKHAYQTLETLLFDKRVPIKLKLAMHQSVSKWLTTIPDRQMDQVQSRAKRLIDQEMTSQTNTNDVVELLLMVIQQLVEQAGNNQQLEQLMRAADLLVCLRRLLAKIGLQDKHLGYFAQWMLIHTKIVEQISRLAPNCQQALNLQQRIETLMQRSDFYSMGVTILKFKGVSHVSNSRAVQCAQQITDCDQLDLFELRVIYFQMLLAAHKLASQTNSRTIPSKEQQAVIMDWTMIGIHCYLKQQPALSYEMKREEVKYRLQAALLGLYYHLTKDHYHNIENLIEKGYDLKQNVFISQLAMSSYEHLLFQNDTEYFLDVVEDFSSGKAQLATPKAQLSQLISSVVSKVENFKLQFILMAKFQLQRALCSYVSGYYDGSQNTLASMSVQASLLILCFFARYLRQNTLELAYFRKLFHAQHLPRLTPISIALVFELSIVLDYDFITNEQQPQSYDAFDLALWTKQPPLRLAALRCLHHFCSEHYCARHLADVFQMLAQNREQFDLRELGLAWNIVRTTVESHMNTMNVSWLMSVLKKLIIRQLFQMALKVGRKSGVYSWAAVNGIQVCLMVVQNIASECLNQSILEISMQIALLYRDVMAPCIKQQILSLVKAVCSRVNREKRDFPKHLPPTVPLLLRDISTSQDISGPYRCQLLPALELIVITLGAKRRPRLLRKIKPILTTISHLFSLYVLKLQHRQLEINLNYLYGYLVIMNRLVQYFGAEIESESLKGWVLDCRKLQLCDIINTLKQRITSFIFACSVYLKEAAMFATMLQTVSRQKFTIFEKEMMLDTLAIFFSTSWAVGGIFKYVYLIKLLHLLTTLPIQFEPNTDSQSIEGFMHKSRNFVEYEEYCIKVYLLFKSHKHSLYCYLNAYVQPGIMRQFHGRQVVMYAYELLEKDTCMNYRASNWQMELRDHYKLQLCNPLGKRESLLGIDIVGDRILDFGQQQGDLYVDNLCRKLIKRS